MNIHEYIGSIRKNWLVVAVLALLGAGAGYGYAQTMPDMYRSTASAYASTVMGETTSELVQGSTYVQGLVQSYATMAKTPIVLQPVIDKLDLDMSTKDLERSISVDTPLNTVIIDVTVVSSDPIRAQQITSEVTRSLATAVADISSRGNEATSPVELTIISPATAPSAPFSPDTRMIVAIGGAIGLLLGLAWAVLRELIDTRIRSQKDIEAVTDSPILAEIGRGARDKGLAQTIRTTPNGPTAEAFRGLCMSLAFADVDKPVSAVVVTSAMPAEGKSSVSLGLALSLAESMGRVLLVDADLRKPSIADHTGLDGSVGLTSVLLGSATIDEAVQSWGTSNLDILVAGTIPPNPNQLLASDTMRATLTELKKRYDFVVIDTSPLIPVTDPLWLVHETDGAIVVARNMKTRRPELSKAMATLGSVGARVLGVVANDVKKHERLTYYTETEKDSAVAIPGVRRLGTGGASNEAAQHSS
ncbi:capsular exopolysaccharide synthesis family protein [Labedella gwakjiensis]|uniref:non-specific protein-tyrosine kinase n=1 Tax=Labedella gwakjiensis TaxID=390269 RepID=A0A2P8GSE2_9MICO|nr:polysaccharide biosynthesis tyrosine autokinase [Labedella gwakjiensis]PSL36889.1 capsular exopolysaccharide synthesis family protein [Labedella gwakjiensis]RUQ84385.1 polysaccharide biosynthesis tyrosine autokinase [Labedella gwakjiensis]